MRLIDADALKPKATYMFGFGQNKYVPLKAVENAPAVDAVEVVRCKDCIHYKPQNQSAHWTHEAKYCCRSVTVKMEPDGFCCYGERNEK